MNVVGKRRIAASDETIDKLEKDLGVTLPEGYRGLLRTIDGFILSSGVTIYPAEDVKERNRTFEVETYAPGFLAIGDDGGGVSVMLDLRSGAVLRVDQGSMDPDDMELLALSVNEWINEGARVWGNPGSKCHFLER